MVGGRHTQTETHIAILTSWTIIYFMNYHQRTARYNALFGIYFTIKAVYPAVFWRQNISVLKAGCHAGFEGDLVIV